MLSVRWEGNFSVSSDLFTIQIEVDRGDLLLPLTSCYIRVDSFLCVWHSSLMISFRLVEIALIDVFCWV